MLAAFSSVPPFLRLGGDPGRPEAVVAELRLDASRHPPANHGVGVGLGQWRRRQRAGAAPNGVEQRPLVVRHDAGLQAATDRALECEESRPVRPGFARADVQPDDLPLALGIRRQAVYRV